MDHHIKFEHPDPAIQKLVQAALDKAAEQMACVHEYAVRPLQVGPDAYFCRKCGRPFADTMESFRDCIQIEPRVFVPKRLYRLGASD